MTGIRVSPNGGLTVFEAGHIANQRWNGWARPFFPLAEAHRVVEWILATPFDGETIEYNRMTRRFVLKSPRVADYEYPVVVLGGFVLHGIGAGELLWEEQDDPRPDHSAEWARATVWCTQWIAAVAARDWRELHSVDAGAEIARAGISKWYLIDSDDPFWIELADYLAAQVASTYAEYREREDRG